MANKFHFSELFSYGITKEHDTQILNNSIPLDYAMEYGTQCHDPTKRIRYFDANPSFITDLSDLTHFKSLFNKTQLELLTFILTVCNPVKRLHSSYYMEYKRSPETVYNIEDPNIFVKSIFNHTVSDKHRKYGYSFLNLGLFHKGLKRLQQHFPKNQFLILESSFWFSHQNQTMEWLYHQLGFNRSDVYNNNIDSGTYHAFKNNVKKKQFDSDVVHLLQNYYVKDTNMLINSLDHENILYFPHNRSKWRNSLLQY